MPRSRSVSPLSAIVVSRVVATVSLACVPALVALPLIAQEATHVRLGLVNYVIAGDTASGKMRLATDFYYTASDPEHGSTRITAADLTAIEVYQWSTWVGRLVDSLGKHWRPEQMTLVGPALPTSESSKIIAIGADPHGPRGKKFFFMLNDTAAAARANGRMGWRVPATLDDVDTLLSAMRTIARDVVYDTLSLSSPDSRVCSSALFMRREDLIDSATRHARATADSPEIVDTPPRLLDHGALSFPNALSGWSGNVTARFVVDADGHVDPSSVCIISSSDPGFSEEVRDAMARLRYEPGRIHGTPVNVLVEMTFNFLVGK